MNRKLLEILACPIDKHHPLELHECETKEDVVVEGALYCTKCSRFFAITEEIPIMMPDDLRDRDREMCFLKSNRERLPDKIIKQASPWHL